MSILQNSNAISAGGYDINNSLRFRRSASAYLSRTPASAGNQKTYTISFWYKRGLLTSQQGLFEGYVNSGTLTSFNINTDTFNLQIYNSPSYNVVWATTAVFRDPSAWYHVVLTVDTTQASQSNMVKLYINGVQQTFNYTNYIGSIAQNTNTNINASGTGQYIGVYNYNGSYQDGYFAEYYLIDGQALTPSSFGETDTTTGVWKPKAYSGTYGTNGFYLKFSDIATTSGSNAGLGKDFSGNTNYWTTNNISVTAGVTYDAMTDSPTLTSATVANYPVMSPINTYSTVPTAGNLNLSVANLTGGGIVATMETPTTGKWYWEVTANLTSGSTNTNGPYIGLVPSTYSPRSGGTNWYTGTGSYYYTGDGTKIIANVSSAYGSTWTDSTANTYVIGVAYDADSGTLTMYRNNTSQGTLASSIPSTGYYPVSGNAQGGAGSCSLIYNFGQRPFSYTPPTGYKALNTYNLPDSTIKKGNSYMDATLYTGNGGATQTITNAAGFKPDFVWVKCRSVSYRHGLFDSVRGVGVSNTTDRLQSNATDAQDGGPYMSSLNSNGFTIKNYNATYTENGQTYVGWQWQAGQGTTSSNTSGSITSTVSVNTTAGFSIVTYTGTGANATVGHGLGVAPKMIFVKNRSAAQEWLVYHSNMSATPATVYMPLNSTAAASSTTTAWNSTAPTSSVFSVGTAASANGSGNSMVAYCWAAISGFSAFGSYTGNGSADGPFVYLGFRPKYVMYKCSSAATTDWIIQDTSRDSYNVASQWLYADLTNTEATVANSLDFLSNGFKIRYAGGSAINVNGSTYIYMAFAENPFKNSLAR